MFRALVSFVAVCYGPWVFVVYSLFVAAVIVCWVLWWVFVLWCNTQYRFLFYNHLVEQERSGYFASLCSCCRVATIIMRFFLAVGGLV